jgi:hypothetical protein
MAPNWDGSTDISTIDRLLWGFVTGNKYSLYQELK